MDGTKLVQGLAEAMKNPRAALERAGHVVCERPAPILAGLLVVEFVRRAIAG